MCGFVCATGGRARGRARTRARGARSARCGRCGRCGRGVHRDVDREGLHMRLWRRFPVRDPHLYGAYAHHLRGSTPTLQPLHEMHARWALDVRVWVSVHGISQSEPAGCLWHVTWACSGRGQLWWQWHHAIVRCLMHLCATTVLYLEQMRYCLLMDCSHVHTSTPKRTWQRGHDWCC